MKPISWGDKIWHAHTEWVCVCGGGWKSMCYCKWVDCSFCGKAFCSEMIYFLFFYFATYSLFSCQRCSSTHQSVCNPEFNYSHFQSKLLSAQWFAYFPTFLSIDFNHWLHTNNVYNAAAVIFIALCYCVCTARTMRVSYESYETYPQTLLLRNMRVWLTNATKS